MMKIVFDNQARGHGMNGFANQLFRGHDTLNGRWSKTITVGTKALQNGMSNGWLR